MALTRTQIQTAFQNSLGRPASTSDENSYFSVSQSGALSDAQIFATISNSREADQIADPVIRFYQSAFGRVPDQAGLANAEAYVRAFGPSAATYQSLSNMFAQSTEFTNRFGTGTAVDAAYVQALYSTILGRSATNAEVDGYVSGAAGYTTRGAVLYAISQSNEAISVSDAAVNGFELNAAQGQAVYSGTLYTTANGQANTPGSNGQTFTLTAGSDTVTGGAGNDTINAAFGINPSDGTASVTTLTALDTINGGGGTNTLQVEGSQNLTGTITNIQNLRYIGNVSTLTGDAIDASLVGGLQNITFSNATLDSETVTDATTTTVNNLSAGQSVGLEGAIRNVDGAADLTVNYKAGVTAANLSFLNVSGTTSAATPVASAVDVVVGGTNVTTINVTGSTSTTGAIKLDATTAANITTLNITETGSANGKFDVTGLTALKTINASASSTGVSVDTTGLNTDLAFTGGAGNDRLTVTLANLNTSDTLNGGAGNDTLVANVGSSTTLTDTAYTALTTAATNSFERIDFNASTGASLTIDTTKFTAGTQLGSEDATGAVTTTFTGLSDARQVFALDSGTNDAGTDVTLALQHARTTATGTPFADTGAVNLTTDTAGTNVVVTATNATPTTGASDFKIINISGSGTVAFDNHLGTTGTSGITVNAAAATGAVTLEGTIGKIDAFTLGGGNDSVTVATFNTTTSTNGGAASAPTVVGSTSGYAALDTISNFNTGDVLKIGIQTQNTDTVAGATTNTVFVNSSANLVKADVTGAVSFEQALTTAEGLSTATKAAYFTYTANGTTDTYVVLNTDAAAATATGSSDAVVKITGVHTLVADSTGIHNA